ncbi:AraC family transcriptional regulator [Nocardia sp. NPDC050712]|uniref:helix-turn-helix transcriptional regulator n=1 Tax=Nocardia sp. NPDC050712 TaxID=3155518 RepID=UPI003405E796
MAGPQLIEVRREEMASRDPQEVVAFVGQMYTDSKVRLWKSPPRCHVRISATVCGEIMATEIRSTIGYSCQIAPAEDQVYFERTLRGRGRMRIWGHDLRQQRGNLMVCPAGAPIFTDCDSHDVNLLHVPQVTLIDSAAEYGIDAAAFRFTGLAPADPQRERFWSRLFDLTHHELTAGGSPVLTELVVQNLTRSLAAAALAVFPNTTMDLHLQPGPGAVGSPALQRAVDYLHANPAQPITVSELAGHAGTSVRALQHAFQNHYDTTPLGYLRRLRLDRAHQDLCAAEPSDGLTVALVAARWGFSHQGRFAQLYTEKFGHSPKQDLRR